MILHFINNIYSSGLVWDEEFGAFLEPTQISSHTPSQTCAICDSEAAKGKSETPTLSLGSISYLGIIYHELDFVYVLDEQDDNAPYKIGQILSFTQDNAIIQVQIRQLKHYDDLVKQEPSSFHLANWKKDEVLIILLLYSLLIYAS